MSCNMFTGRVRGGTINHAVMQFPQHSFPPSWIPGKLMLIHKKFLTLIRNTVYNMNMRRNKCPLEIMYEDKKESLYAN